MAEAQVAKLANGQSNGKSTVVSVKSTTVAGQKRKAGENSEVSTGHGEGDKQKKASSRRSMKKAKR